MESCKTPVDPKIKPDPKEKDLSNIPVRQPVPQLSPMSWRSEKIKTGGQAYRWNKNNCKTN